MKLKAELSLIVFFFMVLRKRAVWNYKRSNQLESEVEKSSRALIVEASGLTG